MNEITYKLDELARAADISPRTVRYYVQRGLLPAPAFRGKDTAYGPDHLARLRAIKRLQEAFFPLDAIAVELERRTQSEIERVADGSEIVQARSPSVAPAERQTSWAQPSREGRTFRRIEIAPGVELSIAEDAPAESKRAAEQILKQFEFEKEGARR